jgi:peptide/nickel transport system permease protein
MTAYLLRRLLSLSLSLIAASLVIFLVMEVVPGDPASFMMGINADPQAVAALRTQLGLDQPLPLRYLGWVAGLLQGDFGISYTYRVPVSELIAERVVISLPLTLYALALSTLIAFPAGILAASRRNSAADLSVMGATQLGVAIPNFWFAMILVLVFAVNLRWFSAGGFPGWEAGFWSAMKALTLPAIALALPQASILARVMRSSLIDTLNEDFMRTARAKGLTRGQALRRHALRNALIPVLTIIGLQFSFLLAGGIIIENVFYLPGLGRLAFQAITQRDLIVVRSVVILLVFAVIVVTFLVDLAYAAADPRLRRRRDMSMNPTDRSFLKMALGHPAFVLGFVLSAMFIVLALVSFVWTPFDPTRLDIAGKLRGPSLEHWFGTDHFGRDMFSMIMVGARVSIAVAFVAVGIGMIIGVPLGLYAAARRGSLLDEIIMRGNDLVFAFPSLLLAIMITAVFGPGAINAIIAIGIFNVPVFARLSRGAALSLWTRDFVLAARVAGKTKARISAEHILPNIANLLIVQGTIQFSLAILAEAALAYVGLGAQPPLPSWGRMLADAQTLISLAPHMALFPGFAIIITVLGLNLMGDGLRDLFDPRLRRGR